jgi:hypothetical protein
MNKKQLETKVAQLEAKIDEIDCYIDCDIRSLKSALGGIMVAIYNDNMCEVNQAAITLAKAISELEESKSLVEGE